MLATGPMPIGGGLQYGPDSGGAKLSAHPLDVRHASNLDISMYKKYIYLRFIM
jgi:hypothetical protein